MNLDEKFEAVITKGTVHGECTKCCQPFLGKYDCDEPEVVLECVSCLHKQTFYHKWPDDLPDIYLRTEHQTADADGSGGE